MWSSCASGGASILSSPTHTPAVKLSSALAPTNSSSSSPSKVLLSPSKAHSVAHGANVVSPGKARRGSLFAAVAAQDAGQSGQPTTSVCPTLNTAESSGASFLPSGFQLVDADTAQPSAVALQTVHECSSSPPAWGNLASPCLGAAKQFRGHGALPGSRALLVPQLQQYQQCKRGQRLVVQALPHPASAAAASFVPPDLHMLLVGGPGGTGSVDAQGVVPASPQSPPAHPLQPQPAQQHQQQARTHDMNALSGAVPANDSLEEQVLAALRQGISQGAHLHSSITSISDTHATATSSITASDDAGDVVSDSAPHLQQVVQQQRPIGPHVHRALGVLHRGLSSGQLCPRALLAGGAVGTLLHYVGSPGLVTGLALEGLCGLLSSDAADGYVAELLPAVPKLAELLRTTRLGPAVPPSSPPPLLQQQQQGSDGLQVVDQQDSGGGTVAAAVAAGAGYSGQTGVNAMTQPGVTALGLTGMSAGSGAAAGAVAAVPSSGNASGRPPRMRSPPPRMAGSASPPPSSSSSSSLGTVGTGTAGAGVGSAAGGGAGTGAGTGADAASGVLAPLSVVAAAAAAAMSAVAGGRLGAAVPPLDSSSPRLWPMPPLAAAAAAAAPLVPLSPSAQPPASPPQTSPIPLSSSSPPPSSAAPRRSPPPRFAPQAQQQQQQAQAQAQAQAQQQRQLAPTAVPATASAPAAITGSGGKSSTASPRSHGATMNTGGSNSSSNMADRSAPHGGEWNDDVTSVFFACSALVRLAKHPECVERVVDGGVMPLLLRYLNSGSRTTMLALETNSKTSPGSERATNVSGGNDSSSAPAMISQIAVFALYKLCRPGPHQAGALAAVAESGGLPLLCGAMQGLDDRTSRDMASSVMLDMALVPGVPAAVARLNHVGALVRCLGAPRDEVVRMYALLVLARLSNHSGEVQMDAVREGALEPLLGLVAKGCEEEQTHACRLMAILAQAVPTHTRFRDMQVVPKVMPLLRSPSPSVSEHAASIAAILAQNPDSHFQLVSWGVVPALVPLLGTGTNKAKTYVLATLLLLADSEARHAAVVARAAGVVQQLLGVLRAAQPPPPPMQARLLPAGAAGAAAAGGAGLAAAAAAAAAAAVGGTAAGPLRPGSQGSHPGGTDRGPAKQPPRWHPSALQHQQQLLQQQQQQRNLAGIGAGGAAGTAAAAAAATAGHPPAANIQEFAAAVLCSLARYLDIQADLVGAGAVPVLVRCAGGNVPDAAAHAAEALVQLCSADPAHRALVARTEVVSVCIGLLAGSRANARYWAMHLLRALSTDDEAATGMAGLAGHLVPAVSEHVLHWHDEEVPGWQLRRAKVQAAWLITRLCEQSAARPALLAAHVAQPLVSILRDGQQNASGTASPSFTNNPLTSINPTNAIGSSPTSSTNAKTSTSTNNHISGSARPVADSPSLQPPLSMPTSASPGAGVGRSDAADNGKIQSNGEDGPAGIGPAGQVHGSAGEGLNSPNGLGLGKRADDADNDSGSKVGNTGKALPDNNSGGVVRIPVTSGSGSGSGEGEGDNNSSNSGMGASAGSGSSSGMSSRADAHGGGGGGGNTLYRSLSGPLEYNAVAAATGALLSLARLGGEGRLQVLQELAFQEWCGHEVRLEGLHAPTYDDNNDDDRGDNGNFRWEEDNSGDV